MAVAFALALALALALAVIRHPAQTLVISTGAARLFARRSGETPVFALAPAPPPYTA